MNYPKTLFGTQNAKTIKGEQLGYTTFILYMSPHKQNSAGKNLCPNATPGCIAACLFTAGRGRFSNVAKARMSKSEYFIHHRAEFMNQLAKEISKGVKKYGTDKICIRLNGTSDIPYENIPIGNFPNIMAMFPNVQFYDYTKVFSRLKKGLPSNYHLTFSRAETQKNQEESLQALSLGFNVAAVFNSLPQTYANAKVLDGDEHDLTFLRGNGIVLGLKAKGQAKKDTSGFVIFN